MSYEYDFSLDLGHEDANQKRTEQEIIRGIQALLETNYNSASELERLSQQDLLDEEIARLDQNCPYVDKPVAVSGQVTAAFYNELEERDMLEVRVLDGETLISRGFSIQKGTGENFVVGHLFEIPGALRVDETASGNLTETLRRYYAFAPYDAVTVEPELEGSDRITYLQKMIPDLLDQVDGLLHDAPDSLSALLRLRAMSLDLANTPRDVSRHLVGYVSDMIGCTDIRLTQFSLQGTRNVDISDIFQVTVPYDMNDYTGGGATVLGKCAYLYLSPYTAYVDGEIYRTTDMRWSVGIAVEAADATNTHLAGQTIDVAIADIRDAEIARPNL